jgi:hypothetical protein
MDGHGSHTASTAGGNPVDVAYETGETVHISGMAPRARLAMYKVCWGDFGCSFDDMISGVEQSVIDGVDVLSVSIGGSPGTAITDLEIAFMYAAAAGVFVSTSAGNSGPLYLSMGNNVAPWIMTVGASTHSRNRTDMHDLSVVAPDLAEFSSRGPAVFTPFILKPDIIAPGVNIFAAVSNGEYDTYRGTSMACPHISGLAAVIKSVRPEWSPMTIKSVMMTTAYQTRTDGSPIAGTPYDFGAGHVDIQRALDQVLVYESNFDDWVEYACFYVFDLPFCDQEDPTLTLPMNLNYPSIVLMKDITVTRTLTNIASSTASVYLTSAPSGVGDDCSLVVDPTSAELAPGESFTFTIQTSCLTTRGEPIVWTAYVDDKPFTVRSPVVFLSGGEGVIGDGQCHPEWNNAGHDFDGGDCCPSTCTDGPFATCGSYGYDCVDVDVCDPELAGNGVCDEETNTVDCEYDRGDCCEGTCMGSNCGENGYNCINPDYYCPIESWASDGYCDEENNIASCYYDGGDCCPSTCIPTALYQCDNPHCMNPDICIVNWLGDGYCDPENNNLDCSYDLGDCCEDTCDPSAPYDCGVNGFDCIDPSQQCVDHADVVSEFGRAIGVPTLSCEIIRQVGLCWDRDVGHLARIACPGTCGVTDQDNRIASLAQQYGGFSDVNSCADALQYADCGDHSREGSYLRHLCPCTCNYVHFQ